MVHQSKRDSLRKSDLYNETGDFYKKSKNIFAITKNHSHVINLGEYKIIDGVLFKNSLFEVLESQPPEFL